MAAISLTTTLLGLGPRDQSAHLPVFLHFRNTNLLGPSSVMRGEQAHQRRFERRHDKERLQRRRSSTKASQTRPEVKKTCMIVFLCTKASLFDPVLHVAHSVLLSMVPRRAHAAELYVSVCVCVYVSLCPCVSCVCVCPCVCPCRVCVVVCRVCGVGPLFAERHKSSAAVFEPQWRVGGCISVTCADCFGSRC